MNILLNCSQTYLYPHILIFGSHQRHLFWLVINRTLASVKWKNVHRETTTCCRWLLIQDPTSSHHAENKRRWKSSSNWDICITLSPHSYRIPLETPQGVDTYSRKYFPDIIAQSPRLKSAHLVHAITAAVNPWVCEVPPTSWGIGNWQLLGRGRICFLQGSRAWKSSYGIVNGPDTSCYVSCHLEDISLCSWSLLPSAPPWVSLWEKFSP